MKPRLWFAAGRWVCGSYRCLITSMDYWTTGNTPKEAYLNWKEINK